MESNLASIVLIIFIDLAKIANISPKEVNKRMKISINLNIKIVEFLYKLYLLYLFLLFGSICIFSFLKDLTQNIAAYS